MTPLATDEYDFSTDKSRLDVDAIHAFLTTSYWSPGVPRAIVEKAIDNSLCFGVFQQTSQIGFARVITDKATFAYLADVYILDAHQGNGLGKRLMKFIQHHDDLRGLRRFMLATRDAHTLYAQFGFTALDDASRFMEIVVPDIYKNGRVDNANFTK
jgi:GNAT superfamily N-acetyltransferase